MASTFFSLIDPLSLITQPTTPPRPQPQPIATENDTPQKNIVGLLENKILDLELDRFALNFVDFTPPNVKTKVTDDTFRLKNSETRIRRVTLTDSRYHVGWVVDGDVSNCMCCGIYFFLLSKYHCRTCGNVVCDECSPYEAHIPTLQEGTSRICLPCFREMLRERFTENNPVPSITVNDDEDEASQSIYSPKTRRKKLLVTVVENNSDPNSIGITNNQVTDNGDPSNNQNHVHTTTIGEFYIESNSESKAAQYLRSVSEDEKIVFVKSNSFSRNITHLNDSNRSSLLDENFQRLSLTLSEPQASPRLPIPKPANTETSPVIENKSRSLSWADKVVPKERFFKYIKAGDAYKAQSSIDYGCEEVTADEITNLLHYCLDNIKSLAYPMDTFVVLIEKCDANVNAVDDEGVSPLMKLVLADQKTIGEYFIFFRAADALQVHSKGECPLSIAMVLGRSWVLTEFRLHQEDSLLSSGDLARVRRYIACLVIGGYADIVNNFLASAKVQIDKDEAEYLLEEISKQGPSKDRMVDPVGTFNLLRRLCMS